MDPRAGQDILDKRKFLSLSGLELDPTVVQTVASRYIDYATPVRMNRKVKVGGYTDTHRQQADFISLLFFKIEKVG
jgi:hypothetical protein